MTTGVVKTRGRKKKRKKEKRKWKEKERKRKRQIPRSMIYIRRREDGTTSSSHPLLRAVTRCARSSTTFHPPCAVGRLTVQFSSLGPSSPPPPLSLSFFSSPKRRASSSTLQIFPSFRNFIHFSCQRILQLSVCLWKCRVVRPRRQFSLLPKTSLSTRLSRRNLSVYISRPNPVAQPVWILLVINEKERTTNGFAPSKMILLSRTFIRREEDLSNFPRNSKVRRARWESCAVKIIVFGEWIKRHDTFWCRRNKKKRE